MATTKTIPFSLSVFTKHLTQFAATQGDAALMAVWLREHAPKLNKAQRVEADRAVIATLERKFGLKAVESSKVSLRRLSGFSFSKSGVEDADTLRMTSAANMALSRARDILEGQSHKKVGASLTVVLEKKASSEDEGKRIEALDACYAGFAALIKAGDKTAAKRVEQLFLVAKKAKLI